MSCFGNRVRFYQYKGVMDVFPYLFVCLFVCLLLFFVYFNYQCTQFELMGNMIIAKIPVVH